MADLSLEALIRDYDQRAEQFPNHAPYTDEWKWAMDRLEGVAQGVADYWRKMIPALRLEGVSEAEIEAFSELLVGLESWLRDRGDIATAQSSLDLPGQRAQDAEDVARFRQAVSALPQRMTDLIQRARAFDARLNPGALLTPGEKRVWDLLEGQAMTGKQIAKAIYSAFGEHSSEQAVKEVVAEIRKKKGKATIRNDRDGRGYWREDSPPTGC